VPQGSCSFTLRSCDGSSACTDQTTVVIIAAINDAPTFSTVGPTAATEETLNAYTPTVMIRTAPRR
jgi:hypothetical protein